MEYNKLAFEALFEFIVKLSIIHRGKSPMLTDLNPQLKAAIQDDEDLMSLWIKTRSRIEKAAEYTSVVDVDSEPDVWTSPERFLTGFTV